MGNGNGSGGRSTEAVARRALHSFFGGSKGVTIEVNVSAGKDTLIAKVLAPVIEKVFESYKEGDIPVKNEEQLVANWEKWLDAKMAEGFDQLAKIEDGCCITEENQVVRIKFCLLPNFKAGLDGAVALAN